MPYTAATAGSTGTPAQAFMTALHTLLTATGCFTYVEDVVDTNITSKIYKSPAANNVFGTDWYLIVRRSSNDATSVNFGMAETWDTGAKLLHTYAPYTDYNYTYTPITGYKYDDGGAGISPTAGHGSGWCAPPVTLSASGYQYWVSVTPNRLIVATRIATTEYCVYVGLYDDLLPSAISPFPLVVTNFYNSGGLSSSTREPNTLVSRNGNFMCNANLWTPAVASDDYRTTPTMSRVSVCDYQTASVRGLFKDTLGNTVLSASNGDTMTVTTFGVGGTKTYTRFNQYAWVDQGAT